MTPVVYWREKAKGETHLLHYKLEGDLIKLTLTALLK